VPRKGEQPTVKEKPMGDKGGKKDRDKHKKQDNKKHDEKSREAQDKLAKKKPV